MARQRSAEGTRHALITIPSAEYEDLYAIQAIDEVAGRQRPKMDTLWREALTLLARSRGLVRTSNTGPDYYGA